MLPEPVPERSDRLIQTLVAVVEAMPAPDDYVDYRRFDLGLALKYLGDYATRRDATRWRPNTSMRSPR